MSNAFAALLHQRASRTPIGTWVMAASPLVAEAMGRAGFDWCVIDMEHTPLDMMEVIHLLQAVAGTPMVPAVRVPWNDTVTIKRVMDGGATTLLVPFVQSAEEARRAVAATRYPPEGIRGMAGMSRASAFGTTPDYLGTANAGVCVIVQLETPQAVAALDEIAAVPGVDAIFLGPGDLSASMGHVGQPAHPEVFALMQDAARCCRARGMPVGTVGGKPELVQRYRDAGFDFVAIASDLGLLMSAAQGALAALKNQSTTPTSSSAY